MTATSEVVARTAADGLLEVRHASRRFGDTPALDDVSMLIRENELFALLGPSGSGKTTLLRVIAGFEQLDEGQVLLGGRDLLSVPPHRRPVNLMFQSYALFPHISVARNIAYGLEREGVARREVRTRVAEVMATMGISALADRRPAQLSGGERQRVALARAIVKRPRVLLLDEPLSALDRKIRIEMQAELKRLQHEVGITFVMVTHDQHEAMSMADRIAVMAQGRLQQLDEPVVLYRRPANLFVADFVGTSNLLAGHSDADTFLSEHHGRLPMSANPRGIHTGHLLVRPEDVRLVPPEAGAVQGTVVDTQFHGASSTVLVATSQAAPHFAVLVAGLSSVRPGDRVGLTWNEAILVGDEPA